MSAGAPRWWTSTWLRCPAGGGCPRRTRLAAMNIADLLMKEQETSENLRRQVKENLEEANTLKLELSEAKREIFKLGTRK